MSDVFSDRKSAGNGGFEGVSSIGDYTELPKVSKFLCGVRTADNRAWDLPPHTLIMWAEGSLLKFLFSAGDDQPRLFGSCSGLERGFQGVEVALASGHCEWKKPKGCKK